MVTRRTSWAYVAAVLLLTGVSTATAKYSGGTGEPNDPYQIATAADLIALGETPEDYDKHFLLTADIDLDPNLPGRKVFDRAVIAPDIHWNGTLGLFVGGFSGVFDGHGHTIAHLTIRGTKNLGLLGVLASSGELRDLWTADVSIVGSEDNVGGLVGSNAGTVTQCHYAGTVGGKSDVGGLAGINAGTVTQSHSTGAVSGSYQCVGGLVGRNDVSVITCCYSTAGVTGIECVGGLIGASTWDCGNYWRLTPPSKFCDLGVVARCYSAGVVTGVRSVGGLVGSGCGYDVTGSVWDTETSGQTTSAGGTGKTTAEMRTGATFLDAGWDFVGETANGTEDIWWIDEGKDYPRLWWELDN